MSITNFSGSTSVANSESSTTESERTYSETDVVTLSEVVFSRNGQISVSSITESERTYYDCDFVTLV
jgi:hypothetical protein